MKISEAKQIIRIAYNNGEISKEVWDAYKSVVNTYEKRLEEFKPSSKVWTDIEERHLIHLYYVDKKDMPTIAKKLNRTVRAIEKRISYLQRQYLLPPRELDELKK